MACQRNLQDHARRSGTIARCLCAALGAAAALAPTTPHALDPSRSVSQFVQDRYTDRDGLPQNSVRALLAARRGDLWLGTDEGLARFDGSHFTVYDRRTAPGLDSNLIYALAEDEVGAVWIGTLDAGLFRFEEGRVSPAVLPGPLPSPQINALLDDGRGVLWIGTRHGLARLEGGALRVLGREDGLPSEEVRALALADDGALWVGTDRGAAVVVGGAVRPGPPELGGMQVRAILCDRAGDLWFAAYGHGLARRSRAGGAVTFQGDSDGVPAEIHALYLDRNGTLWLGASTGLVRLRNGRPDRLVLREGADPVRAWAIAEDREGNLWSGYEGGGLVRLRDGDFGTLGKEDGLPEDMATTVVQASGGDVWIGTFGGLGLAPGGDPARLRMALRTRRPVTALLDDGHGGVWVGLVDGSLRHVEAGLVRTVAPATPTRPISALALDEAGTLWVGTFQGLHRLAGAHLEPADRGLPAGVRVNVLAWAPDGALWAGLEYQGVFRCPPGGRFERVPGGPPPGRDVNDLLFDADGTVWIGTLGAGLWRWRDGHGDAITTHQGLPDDAIWRLLDDGLGHLWFSSNKGVFRVGRAELGAVVNGGVAQLTALGYGVEDGMRSRECNGGVQPAGARTADGRLWFPTVKGVSIVDPARLRTLPAPPVVIERAAVDGVEVAMPTGALVLPPGTSRVVIGYSAIAFSSAVRVRFRFRLEGHDGDWVYGDAGERTAVYTSLEPGTYRFTVQARLGDEPWREGASLGIAQRPRLLQRPWFHAALGACALALLAMAYRLRMRRVRAREKELEVRVKTAVAELRKLERLIPLCAWCKKIRDEAGDWKKIEVYLAERGVADVTHALCPECLARHFRHEPEN